MKVTSTTKRKLFALYASEERRHLILIRQRIARPLGDWQCTPNPHAIRRGTAKLTAELLPAITGLVYGIGGPTVPIPIEEQLTDRIPLEM